MQPELRLEFLIRASMSSPSIAVIRPRLVQPSSIALPCNGSTMSSASCRWSKPSRTVILRAVTVMR
jgi:hypothetical protein